MSKTDQEHELLARIWRGELECGDLDNPALSKLISDWEDKHQDYWDEPLPTHMGGTLMFTVDFTDNVRVFEECISCGKLLKTEDYMAHCQRWVREDPRTPPLSDSDKRLALADMRRFARLILGVGGE